MKINKTITIDEKLHEALMMEKIQRKAKSMQELLQMKFSGEKNENTRNTTT